MIMHLDSAEGPPSDLCMEVNGYRSGHIHNKKNYLLDMTVLSAF